MQEFEPIPDTVIQDPELASQAVEQDMGSVVVAKLLENADEAAETAQDKYESRGGETLNIKYRTFEEARGEKQLWSKSLIDDLVDRKLVVDGADSTGIKSYLDTIEKTTSDREVLADPERIGAFHESLADMITRNLRISIQAPEDQIKDRSKHIGEAKQQFLYQMNTDKQQVAARMAAWSRKEINKFPNSHAEFKGLYVEDKDLLDFGTARLPGVAPNIRIQRDGIPFVVGYSDARVSEKLTEKDEPFTQRIYLNPDIEGSVEVFEKVLNAANDAGISIQLKVLHRSPELAGAHLKELKGRESGGLRGDGIVVYTHEADADRMLSTVLDIADEKPDIFAGRSVSRVPQQVADGIAIGDEPEPAGSASLTAHRARIIQDAAMHVAETGLTDEARYREFSTRLGTAADRLGVDYQNLAFNKRTS